MVLAAEPVLASSGGHASAEHGLFAALFPYYASFTVYVLVMFFLLRKPAVAGWKGRRDRIKNEVEEREQQLIKARENLKQVSLDFHAIDKKLEAIKAEIKAETDLEVSSIIERAKERASRIKVEADKTLEAERTKSLLNIKNELANQTILLAQELLRQRITPEQDRVLRAKLVDRSGELVH